MKLFFESWPPTILLDKNLPQEVVDFINTDNDKLTLDMINEVCNLYQADLDSLKNLDKDDIDSEIENHQLFYKKWKPLADKVRAFEKISQSSLPGIEGYGELNQAVRIKANMKLRDISYGFPHGWKFG